MIYKNVNGTQKLVTNIRKPKKWKRFEYILSSGTLYLTFPIDIKARESFGIELDFMLLSTTTGKMLIEANVSNLFKTSTYTYTSSTGSMLFASAIGTISTNGGWSSTKDVRSTTKLSTEYKNSTPMARPLTSAITSLKLLGSGLSARVYEFKIIHKEKVIYHLVPCQYEGRYGLWSLLEDKFYGNEGTGAFTVGPEVANYDEVEKLIVPSKLLPSGVELYDYIENDGNQWIDTNIIANSNTKVETKFLSSVVSPISVYGSQTGSADGFRLFWLNNVLYAASGGYRAQTSMTPTTSIIYTTIHSYNTLTINNISYSTASGNVFGNNLLLMRDPYSDSYRFNGKFYYCKIYNGNSLIRNLIPCTYFGEPGIWDTVTKLFYRNLGTGEFKLGNKLNLRQYSYLKGDGNLYINTEYYPNVNTKLILKRADAETGDMNDGEINGSSASGGNFYISETLYAFDNSKVGMTSMRDTSPHIIQIDINGLYINNTFITKQTSYGTNWSSPRAFYLFGSNKGNSLSLNCNTLYYCLFYENNILVRDFVPVSCNGEYGLLDKVEMKFYTKIGTGNFLVGPPIDGEIPIWVLKNALVGDGNAYISTGVLLDITKKLRIVTEVTAHPDDGNPSAFFGTSNYLTGIMGIYHYTNNNEYYLYIHGQSHTGNRPFDISAGTLIQFDATIDFTNLSTVGTFYNNIISGTFTLVTDTTNPITIFKSLYDTRYKGKCYKFLIYEDDILIRDFVPATMGGRPGLYDKVNHKMYFNANSSGNFTVE